MSMAYKILVGKAVTENQRQEGTNAMKLIELIDMFQDLENKINEFEKTHDVTSVELCPSDKHVVALVKYNDQ